jgi:hypothetical protein
MSNSLEARVTCFICGGRDVCLDQGTLPTLTTHKSFGGGARGGTFCKKSFPGILRLSL